MDALFKLLQKIRIRPTLYLGEYSLNNLFFTIVGYTDRAREEDPMYHDCVEGFDEYVHEVYSDNSTGNYVTILTANTSSDKEALEKFFELLDEFVALKERK